MAHQVALHPGISAPLSLMYICPYVSSVRKNFWATFATLADMGEQNTFETRRTMYFACYRFVSLVKMPDHFKFVEQIK